MTAGELHDPGATRNGARRVRCFRVDCLRRLSQLDRACAGAQTWGARATARISGAPRLVALETFPLPTRERVAAAVGGISDLGAVEDEGGYHEGDSTAWVSSTPVRLGCRRSGSALFLDEADVPAGLDDAPLDLVEGGDLLLAHLFGQLVLRHALAIQVVGDELSVLDHDDWKAFQHAPSSGGSEAQVRAPDLEDGDRRDRDESTGNRIVVLCKPLLDGVTENDQQNEIDRAERGQLTSAGDAHDENDEGPEDDCPEHDVHQGYTVIVRSMASSFVSPSSSSTSCAWRPAFVGFT